MEEVLEQLLAYGEYTGLIEKEDTIYCYNSLAGLLSFEPKTCNEGKIEEEIKKIKKEELESGEYLEKVLKEILDYALVKGIVEDDSTITKDLFDTRVMGVLTDRPSNIRKRFWDKYASSPKEATEYFYKFSQDNDYIRRYRIKKDIRYKVESPYGELDITIN